MFDFPSSPTIGQQVIEPNGAAVQWDGTKWASVAGQVNSVAPLYNNIGRNLIHNSMFNINQRGLGSWTTSGVYTSDRWYMGFSGGTYTASVGAMPPNTAAGAFGDEACQYIMINNVAGTSGVNDYSLLMQKIENVRRLSGKTITLSFWSWSDQSNMKIGVELEQQFGSGGSAAVVGNGSRAFNLVMATPTRFSTTITLPSVSGKTINAGDLTQLNFWLSNGSGYTSRSGGVGVQTATIYLWGVQLEIGSTMTPLEKLDPRIELSNCQRFFERKSLLLNEGLGVGTVQTVSSPVTAYFIMVPYKVTKRAVPTTTMSAPNTFTVAGLACSNVSVGASTNAAWMHFAATGGSTGANWAAVPVASDGSLPAYIDFSADL